MCGHVGCAGPLSGKHEKTIRTLLILDSLRGTDSTGVAVISRTYDTKVAKNIGDPYQLFDNKKYDKAFQGQNSVVIGHNRFATQGKVSVVNAHPFEYPSVVGAHNGTLDNKHKLLDGHLFDVDSEALFNHIDKEGIQDAIHTAGGAWALVFWDKNDKTINFIRNIERPLYLTEAEGGVIFWASEKWMLEIALSRNDIKHGDIIPLEIDKLMTIQVDNKGMLDKPHLTPLKSKVEKHPFTQRGWTNTSGVSNNGTYHPPVHTPVRIQQQSSTAMTSTGVDSPSKSQLPYLGANPYTSKEEVVVEVIGEGLDTHGSAYFLCKDRKHPSVSIRLYKNQNDKSNYLNRFITCELHAYRYTDRLGAYHKVQHSTVRLTSEEGKKEVFYTDAKGKLITEEEWNVKHGTCSWCTGQVDPNQDFRFTKEGDAVCHLCVSDKEVHQYVNFV